MTSYYKKHVFFCCNQRTDGSGCCNDFGAEKSLEYTKTKAKELGLGAVRINRAGCLGRCDNGPVVVVYPQGTWYTYLDLSDLDEIIASDLQNDQVVERLLIDTK